MSSGISFENCNVKLGTFLQLGLCLGWKGQLICCVTTGREGGRGREGMRQAGREGRREGGREGLREGGRGRREGGREGGREVGREGGMTVIHILIVTQQIHCPFHHNI